MFFDLKDLLAFSPILHKVRLFDNRLRELLDDLNIKGVRAWEYGKLLSLIELSSKPNLLDIGPGSSTFSYYLASKGAKVTTLDLPEPMEKSWKYLGPKYDVCDVRGTVLNLPFLDNVYDFVISISVIEHLDTDYSKNIQLSENKFISNTKKALKEMIRVLKKGGKLYITTDTYLSRQKTDKWKTDVSYNGIGGAYKFKDIKKVIIETIEKNSCKLIYDSNYSTTKLINSTCHTNYRGRYFTTFALWCEKL